MVAVCCCFPTIAVDCFQRSLFFRCLNNEFFTSFLRSEGCSFSTSSFVHNFSRGQFFVRCWKCSFDGIVSDCNSIIFLLNGYFTIRNCSFIFCRSGNWCCGEDARHNHSCCERCTEKFLFHNILSFPREIVMFFTVCIYFMITYSLSFRYIQYPFRDIYLICVNLINVFLRFYRFFLRILLFIFRNLLRRL